MTRDAAEPLYMGIDGGGSNLRVVVADAGLHAVGVVRGPAANPSTVGRAIAAKRIQQAMRESMADVRPEAIAAVGIGIAGAAASHSRSWLVEVVQSELPMAQVVPSSDYEIALTGAFGERLGVVVIAGTGSLAYGVNEQGMEMLAGGWGYLLGDEGSGYWLGLEALRQAARRDDEGRGSGGLGQAVIRSLGLGCARDIVAWLYGQSDLRTSAIAQLAPVILGAADGGDACAQHLVQRAAEELARLVGIVQERLSLNPRRVAFGGGLLSEKNALSDALVALLSLADRPRPHHTPAIGAVLLARAAHLSSRSPGKASGGR